MAPLAGAALVLAAAIGCDDKGGGLPAGGIVGGPSAAGAGSGTSIGGPGLTGEGAPTGGTPSTGLPPPRGGTGGAGGTTARPGTGGVAGGRGGAAGTAPAPTPPPPGSTPPGPAPAGGVIPMTACKNIDLVFSIDNSSSMREEQMVMGTTIFPAFAQKLRMISPTLQSFRVGVLDACPLPASYHTRGRMGPCMFVGGKPWIESSSPRLDQEFACVGAIDSTGKMCAGNNDDEQPVSTATASLEAPAATGPNAGFLRKDAVLVVLAMTDEDEQPTPARTAQQVADRLVAIKGDPRMVVLLGIGGSRQCRGPYGDAVNAQQLQAITQIFTARNRGVFWDLCAGSLEQGLGRAIEVIQAACKEAPPYTPPPPTPPYPRDAGSDYIIP